MESKTGLGIMALCGLCWMLGACGSDDVAGEVSRPPTVAPVEGAGAAGEGAPSTPSTDAQSGMLDTAQKTGGKQNGAGLPTSDPAVAAPGEPGSRGDGAMDASDPTTPFASLPAECRGFEVAGLTHSPGGNVLPNTCAPYHGVRNNPYAIRCIDADPNFSTPFPGDDSCILPPPPELGTQVKVSPDDYNDPESWFVMSPGEEHNDYFYSNSTNEEEHFFYRVNMRMRAGSHHMINRMLDADRADGPSAIEGLGLSGSGERGFPGAQRPDQDRPMSLEVPPENAGHGDRLLPHQQFSFNLHHFNLTEGDLLREVWINIWYKPADEVTDELGGISMFGNPADLNIPPGEHRELHYACDVQEPTRIVSINGHRHASTDRFGIWVERSSGETVSIYESFDYFDMPTYQFDSITENPEPSLENQRDGGYTGVLDVGPGDSIHFICDVTNHNETSLRFANEVKTGEMCIVFGSRTGGALCRAGTRVR